jgi:inward rectifier potassium channel
MDENVKRRNPPGMSVRSGAFELRGVRRLDWRDPYHLALALSWPRFICLFIGLDLTLNLFFASAYLAVPGSIANAHPGSLADAFFFSLETLATVGYGVMAPATVYGHIVASIEILTGMIFIAIMTGLTFVRFSRPRARVIYADNPVICRFNGKPTLMVRIGNGREHGLTDATAQLGALVNEWTTEGHFFRRVVDLHLVRSRLPLFALTWTLMHEIDETSPLYGRDAKQFGDTIVRLFLSIEARDPALAARVYDIRDYAPEDIFHGHRYVDAVAIDDDGHTIADLNRLSWIEPETAPKGKPFRAEKAKPSRSRSAKVRVR